MKNSTLPKRHPIVLWIVTIAIIALSIAGCAVQKEVEPVTAEVPKNVVKDVRVVDTHEATKVVVEAEAPLQYTFFRLIPEPLELVVDIPQTELSAEMPTSIPVADETISEIVAREKEGKAEIGIKLNELVKYDVEKEGAVLSIEFEKKPTVVAKEEVKEEPKEVVRMEAPPVIEEGPPVAAEIVPEALEALGPAKSVVDVSVDTSEKERVVVSIKGDGKMGEYSAFGLEKPTRLVVDLKNLKREFPRKSVVVDSPYLSEVRLGDHPTMVRAVLDVPMETLPGHSIDRENDLLKVTLGEAVPVTAPPSAAAPVPEKEVAVEEVPKPPAAPVTGQVTGVDFKQLADKSRLVITTSTKASYDVVKGDENTLLIELRGMVIPKKWIRHLDTQEFASPVDMVTPSNITVEGQDTARLLIKLRRTVAYDVRQEETKIYLDFERPEELRVEKPKPIEVMEARKPEEVKERPPAEEQRVEVAEPPEAAPTPRAEAAPVGALTAEERIERKAYTGKKITLDFKDADIGNILRLFAEVSDLNIIATEDVKGTVTVRLVDVPWDQALDVVLQAKNLGMERIGNVIRIAPIDRLRRERETKAKAIKATEELEPLLTELIPVSYSKGAELAPKIKDVLSERGTVTVDERTNMLIVKDIRSGLEDAKDLAKKLDAQTPQVLIQAKIVEASTNFTRELGISWGGSWMDEHRSKKTVATVEGASSGTFAVDLPATVGQGSGGAIDFLISNLPGTKFLEVKLSALEESGEGKILSSPRITTLDHTEAYIEQGVRIPYPKLTEEGTVTTEFIEANLKLTVTPHVTADGHIKMEIIASKDSPDFTQAVLGVPAIDKKEAKTEVLVKDGEVVVIGGVYTFDKTDTLDGVPFLHEIPILGWAFKKRKKENEKRELLIFIAPRIVQPRRTVVS